MTEIIMTLEEFTELQNSYRLRKPNLFALAQPDVPANPCDIAKVEQAIGATLPKKFKEVLEKLGGGIMGFITIFSADDSSENYLPAKQAEVSKYLPSNLLAFCDDYSGGLYVFKILEGNAGEEVYYWNLDGGLRRTEFESVLEFLARYAYEPA